MLIAPLNPADEEENQPDGNDDDGAQQQILYYPFDDGSDDRENLLNGFAEIGQKLPRINIEKAQKKADDQRCDGEFDGYSDQSARI